LTKNILNTAVFSMFVCFSAASTPYSQADSESPPLPPCGCAVSLSNATVDEGQPQNVTGYVPDSDLQSCSRFQCTVDTSYPRSMLTALALWGKLSNENTQSLIASPLFYQRLAKAKYISGSEKAGYSLNAPPQDTGLEPPYSCRAFSSASDPNLVYISLPVLAPVVATESTPVKYCKANIRMHSPSWQN